MFIDQNRDKRTKYSLIRNVEFDESETYPNSFYGPKRSEQTLNPLQPMYFFICYFLKIPKDFQMSLWADLGRESEKV